MTPSPASDLEKGELVKKTKKVPLVLSAFKITGDHHCG